MKKVFFTLCMFMAVASFAQSSEYREGFKDGYCEGWKDVKGQYAYCPYAPLPTISLNMEGTIIEEAITQDLRKADELHIKNNYK